MASIIRQREHDLRTGPQPQLSKTCQNCSHAKIRCDRTQNLSACDRCHRLGKHCVFRPTKRRYNGTKRDITPPVTPRLENVRASVTSNSTVQSESSRTGVNSSPYSDHEPVRDVIEAGLITFKTAEYLLEIFKTNLTPHFPFVVIAPQVTVEELRHEKPFLLLSVLSASCYEDMPLQRALGSEMKQAISNRVILGGAISFELLQGLLVHLAWSQYHPRPRRYSQYLQLAISIIVDLRLDRPLESRSWKLPTANGSGAERAADGRTKSPAWGRDEQRAVAGCYYLSSTVSLLLQKLNTFPYSPSIEISCTSLSANFEYPTDKHLVHIVRLQHLLENIEEIASGSHDNMGSSNSMTELSLVGFKSELDSFKKNLPFAMNESHMLLIQFHVAELFLCQAAIFDRHSHLISPQWSSSRFDFLCTGLSAATALFGYYLSLHPGTELSFNNSEWIQISFALTVACKLAVTSTEKPVHSQTFALRRSLDMSGILRQLALRTGALVSDRIDAQGDRDVFTNYEQRIKRMEMWFNSHCHSTPTPPPTAHQQERPKRPDLGQHRASSALHMNQSPYPEHPLHWDGVTMPHGSYDFQHDSFLPDATIDDILGDWMTFPAQNT
ncbi:hypothetical protein K490DRAFT_38093 [Saccharata proteae CBS 121410]|uniref:Zn(2)-C6 fungal-type domain-containing protein n=1 Tax=Saccharata proteae CBS 121410 TaxID=1314787 RepID=A0A6A5YB57_9PEZI|nr:hypothetical protein K490DRAFT_38093 [Saccharata proteae CBS 121410]